MHDALLWRLAGLGRAKVTPMAWIVQPIEQAQAWSMEEEQPPLTNFERISECHGCEHPR